MGLLQGCSRALASGHAKEPHCETFTNIYLIDDWYAVVEVIARGAEQRSSAIVLEE